MGIGGVTSVNNSMSVTQMTSASLKDHKSKNIQNEITEVQQKIQKLSSEDELSLNEKADEKKKLQKEKSSLDTELKQHQEELLRSQKREIRLAELQEKQDPAKEDDETKENAQAAGAAADTADKESRPTDDKQPLQSGTVITQNNDGTVILKEVLNQSESAGNTVESTQAESKQTGKTGTAVSETEAAAIEKETPAQAEEENEDDTADTSFSDKQMQAMVASDTSMKQADRMGTLVTKTEDGIAILKGEIKQDSYRGTDTGRKEAELSDMQKQREREMGVQFALLGEAGHTMKSAAGSETVKDSNQEDIGKNFQVSGLNAPQDEQAAQERFHVAIA